MPKGFRTRRGGFGGTTAPNVPSPAADITGPFAVARVFSTPAVGDMTFTFFPAGDLQVGADPVTGVKEYERDVNGGITVVSATQPNDQAPAVISGFNGATTTGSYSGKSLTLRGNGNGVDLLNDSFSRARQASVTGAKVFYCHLASATTISGTPGLYYSAGMHIRFGSAVDAPFVQVGQFLNPAVDQQGFEFKYRSASGATYVRPFFATGDNNLGALLLYIEGTIWQIYAQRSSGAWLKLGEIDLPWATGSMDISTYIQTGDLTSQVEVVFDSFFYAKDASPYAITTGLSTTNQTCRVRARDFALNYGPWSATITASPLTSGVPANYIKYNPQFGFQADHFIGKLPTAPGANVPAATAEWAQIESEFAALQNETGIKFYHALVLWGVLEPTQGVYDFSCIERLRDLGQQYGVRVGLGFWTTKFQSQVVPAAFGNFPIWPQWQVDNGSYMQVDTRPLPPAGNGSNAIFTSFWRSNTMDKFILLLNAIGAIYDSDPFIELISCAESSVPTINDYTVAGARTQFHRMTTEIIGWPHTIKLMHINFFGSVDDTRELCYWVAESNFAYRGDHLANGWGIGGPDMLMLEDVGGGSWGDRTCQGQGNITIAQSANWWGNYGTRDLRGKIPIAFEQQNFYDQPFQGSDPQLWSGTTAVQYEAYGWNSTRNTHSIWRGAYGFHSSLNWDTGGLPAIRAQGARIRNPGCPEYFGGVCATGLIS